MAAEQHLRKYSKTNSTVSARRIVRKKANETVGENLRFLAKH